MRIVNVVKIKNGVVDEIESFGIVDEQLEQDVVDDAEDSFMTAAREIGLDITDDDELGEALERGYYEAPKEDVNPFYVPQSVCITWSTIDNVQI